MLMFEISKAFADDERPDLAELLWQGFEHKMIGLYGPKENGVAYFADSFSPERLIVARDNDGHIVGMVGLRTPDGSFAPPRKDTIDRHYPAAGANRIGSIAGLKDNVSDDDVLSMDILSVARPFRNKGLGTQLVEACCREAQRRGLAMVQIPVAEENEGARRLYARLGFEDVGVIDLGEDGEIFGLRRVVTMQRHASD